MKKLNLQNSESLPELIDGVEKATKKLKFQMNLLKRHVQKLKIGK